ncbi:MAG TPA: hypothetical protein VD968_05840 [Pyrinomonadaceae bacterium]|nr:hypothetical protein [Pyrinomonadaceae bacterium]
MWKFLNALSVAAALASAGAILQARAQKKATRPAAQQQQAPRKVSTRPGGANKPADGGAGGAAAKPKEDPNAARFTYEFRHPDFFVYFIHVEHDDRGRGVIRFERRSDTEQITEPFELAPAALERIAAHWAALKFLDSTAEYQGERTYPSYGKSRLTMRQGGRERTAEFNYSQDENAMGLVNEYRKAADQAVLVFELKIALESQPLETPKLIDRIERLIERNALSDAAQLTPLLRELSEDERIPLVGRNQLARILKKLDKQP